MIKYDTLVLAIPHSFGNIKSTWDSSELLTADMQRWTDWHTDKLFTPAASNKIPGVSFVVGNISRYDCDLERLQNDPLESVGQGIIYTRTKNGANRISSPLDETLLDLWQQYRVDIVNAIKGDTLIIDCHSFPSDLAKVDICIGFNEDDTKPPLDVINLITNHFTSNGYSTSINEPYSNSIAPTSTKAYHSLMIEISKALYLDENTLEMRPCAYKVHHAILNLYKKLLGQHCV